jgi:integrase
MGKLTALKVKSAAPGRHADGNGLHLIVRDTGSRQYLLRIQAEKQRRDFGLGAAETQPRTREQQAAAEKIPLLDRRSLTLAEARDKADAYRRMVRAGLDPAEERKKAPVAIPTFEKAARDCHDELKKGWRNQKHTDSWLACLVSHVFPAIGDKPVDTITSIMVRDAIAPIWLTIPETARRALQRIGAVLDFAHIKGWRPTETTLKSVRKGLPRQPQTENHFVAMPYDDAPGFMRELTAETPTVGRDALRFTILTAVRSNETRLATWPEFDLEKATWTIPGTRMKMKQTHVVPLPPVAVAILRRRWKGRTSNDGLVFFSNPKKPISDMTMTKVVKDSAYAKQAIEDAAKRGEAAEDVELPTVHGFRSTFTDWAAETTSTPKEVVDKALAHKLPDKVEAAYRRTDFFERRRVLMTMWADFLACASKVVRLAASA